MSFAVELFFDPESESLIRRVWQDLKDAKASTWMMESGCRPHVTLALYENPDLDAAMKALKEFANDTFSLPARLESVATFATAEGVVFLDLVPTMDLLELHAHFLKDHLKLGPSSSARYAQPDRWVPHCTLAVAAPPEKICPIIETALRSPLPIVGRLEQIALVKRTKPVKEVCVFALKAFQ